MKIFILSLLLLIVSIPLHAQYSSPDEQVMSKKDQKKLMKEKRKAEKTALLAEKEKITEKLILQRKFVLKADYISGQRGARYMVNSILNFVLIDSSKATIQIGNNTGIGYNGVGGITVDGNITKFEVEKRQKKNGTNYFITVYISSHMGNYDINMWITPSGTADATVRGTFSGSITYTGQIYPIGKSRTFKGSTR